MHAVWMRRLVAVTIMLSAVLAPAVRRSALPAQAASLPAAKPKPVPKQTKPIPSKQGQAKQGHSPFERTVGRLAISVTAKLTKLSRKQVYYELTHGKSLAQIAAAHKVRRASLGAAILATFNTHLKQLVTRKTLTTASSQTLYKAVESRMNRLLDYKLKGKPKGKAQPKAKPKGKAKPKSNGGRPTH